MPKYCRSKQVSHVNDANENGLSNECGSNLYLNTCHFPETLLVFVCLAIKYWQIYNIHTHIYHIAHIQKMVLSLLQIALIVILLIGCIEGLSMTYFQLMTALYTKTKGPNVIQDENATSWMDDDSSNHHPGEMATDINETHNTYKNNHGNHHQHHQYLESTNNNAPILGLLEENGIARLFIGGQKFRPYFSICCALIGFSFLLQA